MGRRYGEGGSDEYVRELNREAKDRAKTERKISPQRRKLDLVLLASVIFAAGARAQHLLSDFQKPWEAITKQQVALGLERINPAEGDVKKRMEKEKEYLKRKFGVSIDIGPRDVRYRNTEQEQNLGMEAYSVGAVQNALNLYPASFVRNTASLTRVSISELDLESRLKKMGDTRLEGRSAAVLAKAPHGSLEGTIFLQFYRSAAQKKSKDLDSVASDLVYSLPQAIHSELFSLALAREKGKKGIVGNVLSVHDRQKAKVASELMGMPDWFFRRVQDSVRSKELTQLHEEVMADYARWTAGRMDEQYWDDLLQGKVGQKYWSFEGGRRIPENAE